MVEGIGARFRRFDINPQIFFDLFLTHVVIETGRPEADLARDLIRSAFGIYDALFHPVLPITTLAPCLLFNPSATPGRALFRGRDFLVIPIAAPEKSSSKV